MAWNYSFIPKLQQLHNWSLRMYKQFHATLYNGCNYLSMLGLKLIDVSKRGPDIISQVGSIRHVVNWVTHICISKLTITGSDNGLSPDWRQAITRTNAGMWLIRPLGTNLSEILIRIQIFSFKKIPLKMASAKWRPFLSRPQCVNNKTVNDTEAICNHIPSNISWTGSVMYH